MQYTIITELQDFNKFNMQSNLIELQANRSNLKAKKGFTLLELLIVITIIAVLSVAVIIVINPAETIRKARDTQRISDLSTLKTAISLYTSSVPTPQLDGTAGIANALCQPTTAGTYSSGAIWYSWPSDSPGDDISDVTLDGGGANAVATQTANASLGLVSGSGWIKINFGNIVGGSPISNLPIDPTNTIADEANVQSTDLVYRYGCFEPNLSFEVNAQLESTAFTSDDTSTGAIDKRKKDGGNSDLMYESGTDLAILGANHATTTTTGF